MKPSLLFFSAIIFISANSLATAGTETARDSRGVAAQNTTAGIHDRSKTTLRERQQVPTPKKDGHIFWAARLPWTPNAPGD